MATLTIRNLDNDALERFKERARINKRSAEAEARLLIEQAVAPPHDIPEAMERLRKLRETMREKYGVLPDGTDLIRQMRDEE